jgi:hypothetical protein
MLKYLPIATTTAIVNLALVLTNPVQIVNAETVAIGSISPSGQEKLIAKEVKSTPVNARQQQSDIRSIHRTLTEFYRGFNECNVHRMERAAVPNSPADHEKLQSVFADIKSNHVNMSIEVQNIELVTLSDQNATLRIDQLAKFRGLGRSATKQSLVSMALVKINGQWKVSDWHGYEINR